MVAFVGVGQIRELIQLVGVGPFMEGLAEFIHQDFLRWSEFDKSARIANHSEHGVIELMPTSDGTLYTFKFVNGHPLNPKSDKLTVTAFGALADVATGYPLLISEMTLMTAMRTAATSALAARALARPDSRRMGLIGAGAQSEFQALAFQHMLGIDTIRVFDTDHAALEKFLRNMGDSGLALEVATSAADAARGADIITTATADKTNATVLYRKDVAPGTHINAIGGDCPGKTELDKALLQASRVFVEFEPQSRIEGEIQQLPADFAVTELWSVLTGTSMGRISQDEITVFDSVGFAIEDFAALRYLWSTLPRLQRSIDLIPTIDDPKNLFGSLELTKSLAAA